MAMTNLGPTVAGAILQDRREIPFGKQISMLLPSQNPLLTLSSRLSKIPVYEKEFHWFEEYPDARMFTLGTGPTSGAGTITITNAHLFLQADDLLKIVAKSGTTFLEEQVLITNVHASNGTVTITRGYGDNTATDFSGGAAEVHVLGNVSQEGSPNTVTRSSSPVKVYNYTSIIRTGMEISKTADASRQKADPQERKREQRHQGIRHALALEDRMWFGEKNQDISTGPRVRQVSRGVLEFIQTNRAFMSSTPVWSDVAAFAEKIFEFGSDTRYLFCGPEFLTWMDSVSEGKLQLKPGDDTYGVPVSDLETSHGRFRLVRSRIFKGVYSGMAVALDMDSSDTVAYRPLRDTVLTMNRQNPSADSIVDDFLTEAGWQVKQEKLHGILFMR